MAARSVEDLVIAWDLEATGKFARYAHVTEIGAVVGVVRRPGGPLLVTPDRFEELVKPPKPIPPATVAFTGITNEMVANSPPCATVLAQFMVWATGVIEHFRPKRVIYASYNGSRYDEVLLLREARKMKSISLVTPAELFHVYLGGTHLLDPYRLALQHERTKDLPHKTQGDVYSAFYVDAPLVAHRALGDAESLLKILIAAGEYGSYLRPLVTGTCCT